MSLFPNLIPSLTRDPAATCGAAAACAPSADAVKPAYTVQETPEAYRLVVQLPGVAKDGLELTAESNELRITGRRGWTQPGSWTPLHRETRTAVYQLVLTYDHAINADAIVAELRDGVLNVALPKHEAVKTRKIAVT